MSSPPRSSTTTAGKGLSFSEARIHYRPNQPTKRADSGRRARPPSPIGRRWRGAPDEGFAPSNLGTLPSSPAFSPWEKGVRVNAGSGSTSAVKWLGGQSIEPEIHTGRRLRPDRTEDRIPLFGAHQSEIACPCGSSPTKFMGGVAIGPGCPAAPHLDLRDEPVAASRTLRVNLLACLSPIRTRGRDPDPDAAAGLQGAAFGISTARQIRRKEKHFVAKNQNMR